MAELNFSISYVWPEALFSVLVLTLSAPALREKRIPAMAGNASMAVCPILGLLAAASACCTFHTETYTFFGSYRVDGLSQFFKILIGVGFAFAAVNAMRQPTLRTEKRVDYFLFLAMSAWGLTLLSSAAELVTIYLALELSSYSLYILIPVRSRSREASEAGLKYILFGAAATAIALYGLSWIVVDQQTTYISALAAKSWSLAESPLAVMGLACFLGGLFFKLALFPFHFWCPDVYQGASNETAAFAATLPKLGAIIVLIRLCAMLKPELEVTGILALLAAASVTYGNLCALAQKDLKRMLGFSSVAHAGYIICGLVAGTAEGLAAAAFYAMAYLFMNLLCFWVIARVAQDGRNLTYDDLNGLSARSPVLALCLAAAAFSLVSLPPTVGFIGKLWLITALWGHGYDWLVIVVCVNSAIAIFYYLSLVRHAYTEDPQGAVPEGSPAGTLPGPIALADNGAVSQLGAVALGVLVVVLGILPGPVYSAVLAASRTLLQLQ
ncbi:MAG: NADH-quinone oxidoreductase subunit N [Deltaproteobacteria bacterium]|jgi:NADH-quinone oxidoreductase subunit N|nr:NADH-quinone oxidoreductase subunit N [Deltaproteobacteria bacterium]